MKKKEDTQSKDFQWFVKNHDKLFSEYPNKYIVIQDKKVICTGETFENALSEAVSKGFELGSFIIQECAKGENSYIQSFSSRVVFA